MSFTAKYPGICVGCKEDIEPGQIIASASGYNGKRYVHVVCPESIPEIKRPVCQTCFQEVAASGACACD